MIYEFNGRPEGFLRFLEAIHQVDGGTISPGGAAQLLRVTRQSVHQVLKEVEDVRAWVFRDTARWGPILGDKKGQASYVEISLRDLLLYGVRVGRIKPGDALPYVGREWERWLDNVREPR